jgi:enediyne biosynthesis protein E7
MAGRSQRGAVTNPEAPDGPRQAPGPRGYPLFGMLPAARRDRLGLMTSLAAQFGDAVRFSIGNASLYFFNHPDHAKHILIDNASNYGKGIGLIQARRALGQGLLTADGNIARRQRRTILPAFGHEHAAEFTDVVVAETNSLLAWLDRQVDRGPVDLTGELRQLTLRVLGRSLLGSSLEPVDQISRAFDVVQDQAMFEVVTLGMVPHWLPLPRNFRFRRARQRLNDVVARILADRSDGAAGGSGRPDLTGRLLRGHGHPAASSPDYRQLRDELLTVLLAGHETTASTLGWLWHLVDSAPDVAERLQAEARDVLGDRDPRSEDAERLVYTRMVVHEALRLYPPVWLLPRRAVSADLIGGYHVPAGADVVLSPYTLHRHPGFWPDPSRFDPGRFAAGEGGLVHRYAYIPFGIGPRCCIGSSLGMLEATLVTAMVARTFRMRSVPQGQPSIQPMLSLRPAGGRYLITRDTR